MAWEDRSGKSYYYQKRRKGDRIVSQYIGGGNLATLVAELDEIERQQRSDVREQWQQQLVEHAILDSEIAEYTRSVQTITAAVLLASGCHQPKRQWRVKRGQRTVTEI